MAATTADPAVEEGRWEARLHPMRTWRAVGDAGGDTEEDVVREVGRSTNQTSIITSLYFAIHANERNQSGVATFIFVTGYHEI
uniref:Uncharacterized protein n=2 Tax=Oryza TaxID=4527 RepID=Q2RB62_ORYSJ|nr:hypothetical protein LOC_Os11g03080 [Oryza sativa Japonica Group]